MSGLSTVYYDVCHFPWTDFQAQLLDCKRGASLDLGGVRKISSRVDRKGIFLKWESYSLRNNRALKIDPGGVEYTAIYLSQAGMQRFVGFRWPDHCSFVSKVYLDNQTAEMNKSAVETHSQTQLGVTSEQQR